MYKSPFVQFLVGEAVPVTPFPYSAFTKGPVKISIINANAYPLNPPNAKIEPSRAASGSVVGFPSLSSAQPSGNSNPFLFDSNIFPREVTDVAISTAM